MCKGVIPTWSILGSSAVPLRSVFVIFYSILPCYIMRQDYNKEQFEYFKTIMSDPGARVLHLDVVS